MQHKYVLVSLTFPQSISLKGQAGLGLGLLLLYISNYEMPLG